MQATGGSTTQQQPDVAMGVFLKMANGKVLLVLKYMDVIVPFV